MTATTQNMRLPVKFEIRATRVITGYGPNDYRMSYNGKAYVFGNVIADVYAASSESAAIRKMKAEIKELLA